MSVAASGVRPKTQRTGKRPRDQSRGLRDETCERVMIFSINDVYITENMPKFRALIDEKVAQEKPAAYFVTHQGDFLSPSPLSNFDKGANMVEVMNAVGFTHICLGNHEFDVSLNDLQQRLNEVKNAKVITSNIIFPTSDAVPSCGGGEPSRKRNGIGMGVRKDGDETKQEAQSSKRLRTECRFRTVEADITTLPSGIRIGWIGLCTEDTVTLLEAGGLYDHYMGLRFTNFIESASQKIDWLEREGVDIIVPLTHLSMHQDRTLARHIRKKLFRGRHPIVPVILGGHDHDVYFEECEGIKIIKSGMDAVKATVTTITLRENRCHPERKICQTSESAVDQRGQSSGNRFIISAVRSEILDVASKNVDPTKYREILQACEKGENQLKNLGSSLLINPNPMHKPMLSSREVRNGKNTVAQLFACKVRTYYQSDACIFNGGKIRNNCEYPRGLTLVDVQSELPFRDNFMYRINMTGAEIEDALIFSETRKKGTGGYLQYDKGVTFDAKYQKLVTVKGERVDLSRSYSVALPIALLNGMDDIAPLKRIGERLKSKSLSVTNLPRLQDIVTKVCVLERWSEMNLLLKDFQAADTDKDGIVTKEEFEIFLNKRYPDITDCMVELFFGYLDINGSDGLTVEEFTTPQVTPLMTGFTPTDAASILANRSRAPSCGRNGGEMKLLQL